MLVDVQSLSAAAVDNAVTARDLGFAEDEDELAHLGELTTLPLPSKLMLTDFFPPWVGSLPSCTTRCALRHVRAVIFLPRSRRIALQLFGSGDVDAPSESLLLVLSALCRGLRSP
jgi:hypothetical protein